MSNLPRILATAAVLLLAACASTPDRGKLLDSTLYSYAGAVRWGTFDKVIGFIDPDALEASPIPDLEARRYAQYRISGYTVLEKSGAPDGDVLQTVQVRAINVNTQKENVFVDKQRWHFDDEAKRWWLMTGPPKLIQAAN